MITEIRKRDMGELSDWMVRLKANLRLTSDDLLEQLNSCLRAAVASAENYIGQIIMANTELTRKMAFAKQTNLFGPVDEIISVSIDGQSLTADQYSLTDTILEITDNSVSGKSIVVIYLAGMEAAPDDLRAAVLLSASYIFSNPTDTVEALPKASQNLLRPYRNWHR